MKSRMPSDNSDTIGLFPFLAVLLSTMGALLVLLVVLAQKAKQQAIAGIDALPESQHASLDEEKPGDADPPADLAALSERLQKMRRYQQKLAALRTQAQSRLHDEQLRLSHIEEHTRRLEHELAKLHIAAEQLKATEENQIVDQQQAERETVRLRDLIDETQKELEELRKGTSGKRSYAILPYKGPNGTYRRPIYIECSKDGVTIQPEGIRLTAEDFSSVSFDAGTPLAKALRAARELLNTRAVKAGISTPPDPYPLLLVRPGGIKKYHAARIAVESSDLPFGYEFINEDWSIEFPEADPELAREMQHAVMQGRARMAMLARSAPRRYGRQGIGGRLGRHGSGGSSRVATQHTGSEGRAQGDGNGFGTAAQESSRYSDTNQMAGGAAAGTGFSEGTDDAAGQGDDSKQFGALLSSKGQSSKRQNSKEEGTGQNVASGSETASGEEGTASTANPGGAASAASGATSGATTSQSAQASSSGSSARGMSASGTSGEAQADPSGSSGSPSFSQSSGQPQSIAETRGSNWAVENARRGAVPIRRPIQIVVRDDRLAILPSRHATEGAAAKGAVIPLGRPTGKVMDDFAAALRTHMKDWGLAGNRLYWRPVLMLHVGPNATRQAAQLTRLLENSGVEVRLPDTASKPPTRRQERPSHATR